MHDKLFPYGFSVTQIVRISCSRPTVNANPDTSHGQYKNIEKKKKPYTSVIYSRNIVFAYYRVIDSNFICPTEFASATRPAYPGLQDVRDSKLSNDRKT